MNSLAVPWNELSCSTVFMSCWSVDEQEDLLCSFTFLPLSVRLSGGEQPPVSVLQTPLAPDPNFFTQPTHCDGFYHSDIAVSYSDNACTESKFVLVGYWKCLQLNPSVKLQREKNFISFHLILFGWDWMGIRRGSKCSKYQWSKYQLGVSKYQLRVIKYHFNSWYYDHWYFNIDPSLTKCTSSWRVGRPDMVSGHGHEEREEDGHGGFQPWAPASGLVSLSLF